MRTLFKLLSFLMILNFGFNSFAYEQSDAARKYDVSAKRRQDVRPVRKKYREGFKNNYKKYKEYSPERKKRYKNKWSSFKNNSGWNEMTPEQKRRLREKVLRKKIR